MFSYKLTGVNMVVSFFGCLVFNLFMAYQRELVQKEDFNALLVFGQNIKKVFIWLKILKIEKIIAVVAKYDLNSGISLVWQNIFLFLQLLDECDEGVQSVWS